MNRAHRQSTELVRVAAIELHKTLMDAVRVEYERRNGRIESLGELLRLVETSDDFAWLRPLSELIVAFDELLDMPDSTDLDAAAVRVEVEQLFTRSGAGFPERYREMLQSEPGVVMAHSKLKQALGTLPACAPEDVPRLLGLRPHWRSSRVRQPRIWTH